MRRRPTRTIRTDTVLPYTTLFRSRKADEFGAGRDRVEGNGAAEPLGIDRDAAVGAAGAVVAQQEQMIRGHLDRAVIVGDILWEDRRVGKECVSVWRSCRKPFHFNKSDVKHTRR